jgi:hypothetical protein
MKSPPIKNNPRPLWDLTQEVAPGFIRLTRGGKPIAYVLLASHYDEEDIGYMTDPEFWESIRESRAQKGTGIPWEQVKAELVELERAEQAKAKSKPNGRKKVKRNGIA